MKTEHKFRITTRILSCLLVLLLLFCFTACGGEGNMKGSSSIASDIASETVSENTSSVALSDRISENCQLSVYKQTDIEAYCVYSFSEGYATVYTDSGFIVVDSFGNQNGNAYSLIQPFENGQALAQTNNSEWVYIDTNGTVISQAAAPVYSVNTEIYSSSESPDSVELFGVKEIDGDYLTQPIFEWIKSVGFEYNFAILHEDIPKPVMITPSGIVAVTLPDGCIDAHATGENIICEFSNVDAPEYLLTDKNGKVLNETQFSAIGDFHEGIAPAVKNGKLCLIADDGELVAESVIEVDDTDFPPQIYENRVCCISQGRVVFVDVTDD